MHRRVHLTAFGAVVVLTLAACSSGGGASAAASTAPSSAPSVAMSEAPSASAEASAMASAPASPSTSATISIKTTPLGDIVVDAQGRTLYAFEKDSGGKPTCYGGCAAMWPGFVVTGTPTAGTGLDASKLSLVDRTDGGKQVKYGEYPLYYFASDSAPGDTKGQGFAKLWFVVGADGETIKG